MPRMLLIDTCGESGGVALALLQPGTPPCMLAERQLPSRSSQELLLSAIHAVLAETRTSVTQLDSIAVVTGPGSFTGLRIGLGAAKGLSEALDKPIVAVSRLAVLAAQGHAPGTRLAWIDAGRGDVFSGTYHDSVCLDESMIGGQDAAAACAAGQQVVVMEEGLLRLYPAALLVAPVGVRQALPLAAAVDAAGQYADAALLDANYLRVPDAQIALAARLAHGAPTQPASTAAVSG